MRNTQETSEDEIQLTLGEGRGLKDESKNGDHRGGRYRI